MCIVVYCLYGDFFVDGFGDEEEWDIEFVMVEDCEGVEVGEGWEVVVGDDEILVVVMECVFEIGCGFDVGDFGIEVVVGEVEKYECFICVGVFDE